MTRHKIMKSLRFKLTIRSSIIIFFSILLIGVIAGNQITKIEYNNAVESNMTLTKAMSERFNESAEAFIHQIDFVTLDGEIERLIAEIDFEENNNNIFKKNELRSLITLRSIVMEEINGVYLYDARGTLITKWEKTPNRINNYSMPNSIDVGHFNPNGSVSSEFYDGHLVYNRAVRTLETREIAGYISFLYADSLLKNKLDVIAGEKTQFLGLYDSNDNILVCEDEHDRESYLKTIDGLNLNNINSGIIIEVDGIGEMLLNTNEVMNEGWYLLNAVKMADIFETQKIFTLMVITFILAGIIVIGSMTVLNEAAIMKPIGEIMTAVRKVQNENYEIHLEIHTGDEIEILADNFNDMAGKIDELVNQNLKTNLSYKEIQLSQLQNQIKPHFLYNTLECINALSQLGKKDDVRTVTGDFARLMKTKMDSRKFTTVKEELSCAEAFLQIYKIMQGDRLTYSIKLDPQCDELYIPSLIVQPIVENGVLHGIIPSARKGNCTVEVIREDDNICISVSDDGVGFSGNNLNAVNAYIDGNASEEQKAMMGIGIKNVVDRVHFIYGTAGVVTVLSDREWGTIVEIVLPIRF